jgi:hypothetical protein
MSEPIDNDEAKTKPLAPVRRFRVSIREVMGLVAAVAVSLRWPGLSVPVGLLYLYALARRRDLLSQSTRVALGQVALAVYLPPVMGLFWAPLSWWDQHSEFFAVMPAYVPAGLIMGLNWVFQVTRFSPGGTVAMVVLALSPLVVIGGLGIVARLGIAWRIACLVVTLGISALSSFVFLVMFSIPT